MAGVSFDFTVLDDAALAQLVADARAEQQRRALESGDLDALIADGFERGFTRGGRAADPWISAGIVVCPGSLNGSSRSSHECSFVKVGESWVWQAEEKLADDVRPISDGGRHQQRSVTLLGAFEGLELDLVTCKSRQGVHRLTEARSFVVAGGQLELVRTRTVRVEGHGR